jgi:hypothetical protein
MGRLKNVEVKTVSGAIALLALVVAIVFATPFALAWAFNTLLPLFGYQPVATYVHGIAFMLIKTVGSGIYSRGR